MAADNRQLYILAGYPTAGKSSSLWHSARTGLPLFGEQESVVPPVDALSGINEESSTAAKLRAGFWLTLADLPNLRGGFTLPDRMILHLDLLLAFILFRLPADKVNAPEMEAVFARLFAAPALRAFPRCTVTTLHIPIEQIQDRWRHRHPDGIAVGSGRVLAAKDRLIMHRAAAAPLLAMVHSGWDRFLSSFERDGVMLERHQASAGFADQRV